MSEPSDEWQAFCGAFSTFSRHIDQIRTVNVNAAPIRDETRTIAQQYFGEPRVAIQDLEIYEELPSLDASFENLVQLSTGLNAATSYKKQIRAIRKLLPKVTTRLAINKNVVKTSNNLSEDDRVIQTLEGLVPSAALSYKQAITDLAESARVSFRGTALELREALRETLDYLAPDEAVTKADGYTEEKGRSGPTMKQKVRFILKARGRSKSLTEVPEKTASTIDEMIGTLARSVYDRSSIATHVATDRKTVIQIRRYVVAILHHILEL